MVTKKRKGKSRRSVAAARVTICSRCRPVPGSDNVRLARELFDAALSFAGLAEGDSDKLNGESKYWPVWVCGL